MAQADYNIANLSGAAVRSELNSTLEAILSLNSGSTAPTTTAAYSLWADTTTGLLKQRNAANNAFVTIGTLGTVNLGLLSGAGATMTGALALAAGSVGLPSLAFSGDSDTGIYRSDSNKLNIATAGTERVEFGPTEVVFNDGLENYDFRIKGDSNANLFFADASTDRVAFGVSNPATGLHLSVSAGSSTIGNIYLSPPSPGQARFHLYNQGNTAEWLFGQKTNTDHDFKLSKSVAGSELDYLTVTSDGVTKFDSGYGSAAPVYGCRAWVNFNGTGIVGIRNSGNVSSITDIAVGLYGVNFTTSMPDANYAVVVNGVEDTAESYAGNVHTRFYRRLPQPTYVIISSNTDSDGMGGTTPFDQVCIFCAVFR